MKAERQAAIRVQQEQRPLLQRFFESSPGMYQNIIEISRLEHNIALYADYRSHPMLQRHLPQFASSTICAIQELRTIIPLHTISIVFTDSAELIGPNCRPQSLMGQAYGTSGIVIVSNPHHPSISAIAQKELRPMIYEEWYHLARSRQVPATSLPELFVNEGLAGTFADTFCQQPLPSFGISSNQLLDLRRQAYREHYEKQFHPRSAYFRWFTGTHYDVPENAGFAIGYQIVSRYFQDHPRAKIEQLYPTPTADFLRYLRS